MRFLPQRFAFCLALAATAWVAPAQITFDSSFESGNGTAFASTGPSSYDFRIEPDSNSSDRQWYYFEVNGASGQTLTFRLLDRDDTNVSGHWPTAVPVYSTDGGATWDHVTGSISSTTTTYSFTQAIPSDSIRFAFHFPYTTTRAYTKIAEWASDPLVEKETLGQSVQGRPMEYLRITNSTIPDDEKLAFWIISRQHSAEVTGSYTMEGFMEFLLSNDPDARALRAEAIIHAVPLMNPDGAYIGNYRDNSQGVNLNRVWDGSANMTTSPEVRLVQDRIQQTITEADGDYVFFADIHSTSGRGPHFAFHADASQEPPLYPTPSTYHEDSEQFLSLVNQAAPLFNPNRGETSSTAQTLAYHRERIQHGVLAFTFEGTYIFQDFGPNAGDFQTPETHRLVGAAIGRALVDYYELEQPPARTAWTMY